MRYVVIMAGGSGTRLWPLSRKGTPKQLLKIVNGTSLLRLAFEQDASHLVRGIPFCDTAKVHRLSKALERRSAVFLVQHDILVADKQQSLFNLRARRHGAAARVEFPEGA